MKTVWRIYKRLLLRNAFSGEGASTNGGRWNSPGTPMVYTAESQSLAALEILVQTADPNDLVDLDYVAIPVELDERMIDEAAKIPSDWRGYPAPHSTMKIGDQWVRTKSSLALRVPSAIIPAEWNYLLNPAHLDFSKLSIGKPLSFDFDSRLAFKPEKQKRIF